MHKKTYTLDDILSIIASKTRRNEHFDFYSTENLVPGIDKKEFWLSKCISSFANSGGGVLFFGIKTVRGRAAEITPVDFSSIKKNWLENILNREIFPAIKKPEMHFIPLEDHSQKGIIVIQIPASVLRPHMASDNRYYQRVGFTEEVMNEHQVREMYNKASLPQMEFLGIMNTNGVCTLDNGKISVVTFYPKFLVRNSGTGVEKHMKFEIYIPTLVHDSNFTALQNCFSRLEGQYSVFSFPNRAAIYQDEICTIAEAKLSVDSDSFSEFSESSIKIRLYYSAGMKEFEYKLNETFTIDNKILKENQFSGRILK